MVVLRILVARLTLLAFILLDAGPLVAADRIPPLPAGSRFARDVGYHPDNHPRQSLDCIYFPAGPPRPLLVWVHGGAFQSGDKKGSASVWMEPASQGYAVASINYRLSGDVQWPAQAQDCKAALRFLRANARRFNIASERIGIWGSSAGGHLVAFLGATGNERQFDVGPNLKESSQVQCVVDLFGPVDFEMMDRKNDDNSPEAKLLGCAPGKCPAKARNASPLTFLDEDDPPVLILHGDADKTISLRQSEVYRDKLREHSVDGELITLSGVGHQTDRVWELERERIIGFFDSHLVASRRAASTSKGRK